MNRLQRHICASRPLLIALVVVPYCASAGPILGSDLTGFTVLGASTVTNVPTSAIVGDVGVWSSGGANAITGFISSPGVATADPQVTGGSVYAGSAVAETAQGQLSAAIGNLGSLGVGTTLTNPDLAGLTLAPGIYTVSAGTTNLSGNLILNGEGNANAAWVFQMPSTLITSANSSVTVTNTGAGAGVYWDVGSSATIGSGSAFLGNVLALTSITMNSTATDSCGRALASTGAVTLNMNSISSASCGGTLAGSSGLGGGLAVTPTTGGGTVTTFLPSTAMAAPEMDPATAAGGLILLFGAVAVLFDRRSMALRRPAR